MIESIPGAATKALEGVGPLRWSVTRGKIASARAKAQESVKHALKDSLNPHFRAKYADLAAVEEACLPALAACGIAVFQPAWTSADGIVYVTTTLVHESGEWVESDLGVKPPQAGPQALGSCVTYLRRYGLAAAAGVATDDDDGEAAERNTPRSSRPGSTSPGTPPAGGARTSSPNHPPPTKADLRDGPQSATVTPTPHGPEGSATALGPAEAGGEGLIAIERGLKMAVGIDAVLAFEERIRSHKLKRSHPLVKLYQERLAGAEEFESKRLAASRDGLPGDPDRLPAWAGGPEPDADPTKPIGA